MTRLFLRFFLGVIAILIASLLIQGAVFSVGRSRETAQQLEELLGGGARLAGAKLLDGDLLGSLTEQEIDKRMANLQEEFDYPVRLVLWWKLNLSSRDKYRLEQGEVVVTETGMLAARLSPERVLPFTSGRIQRPPSIDSDDQEPFRLSHDYVLRFGRLPAAEGPGEQPVLLGLGAVMLFTAVAIAILLRPIATPLRAVERTATAIAEGDLSARIEPRLVPKGLALASAFNKMADRTESLLRSQRELLQAVSHELRTPLARIRFATDLIETAKTDEERNSRLQSVDSATQRLDDLVGELLTYVRLESDAPNDEAELIELNSLFDQMVDIHAPLHPGIEFDIERIVPNIEVTADRRSVARAISHLLSNAGRYAKSRVAARAIQRSDGVLIQIDYDGDGIPPEDCEKVFDPFVRLTPGDGKGTGLGLALVHRIATRHSGSVVAEQSDLGGARFSFFLPGDADCD
jgi:two-component system sensor histidine kinase RstB